MDTGLANPMADLSSYAEYSNLSNANATGRSVNLNSGSYFDISEYVDWEGNEPR